jgi:hypothetical protein
MPVPKSVDSNVTGLAFAEEASLKMLPGETAPDTGASTGTWYGLEPNSYTDFGATFQTVARETINDTRQRLKGTLVDETAKAGFQVDLTQRNLIRLLQGFFFADAIEKPATQPLNGTQIPVTSVSATQFLAGGGGLVVAGFLVGHLINARNFGKAANNGLAPVTVVAAGALTTSKALTAEAAPPANAVLEVVGFRGAAGDITLTVAGLVVTLGSTALDFTTLGLNVGDWIYIGGDAAITQFATAADTGYARIGSIAAHAIVLDLMSFAPVTDAGAAKTIDLYFGKVLHNGITAASIKRRTYQLERTLGNDGTGIQAEYVVGVVPDQFTLNLPSASKAVADLSFVGLDVQEHNGTQGAKAGTRVGLLGEAAFNTSQDVFLSRLAVVDPTTLNPLPLYAYASDVKLVINNGVKPNKALGVLGGFDVSAGDFAVNGTLSAYFSTVAAVAQIKANADVCLQVIMAKQNAGMILDVPLLTLGGGTSKVEKDKPIMVDLTQDAAKAPVGYTLGMFFFDYLPNIAM